MDDKTKNEYLRLASYHYKLMQGKPYASNIKKYLESISGNHSPDYIRKIRCAFVAEQKDKGYTQNAKEIKKIKNPMTLNLSKTDGKKVANKRIKKRVKHLNDADKQKVFKALETKNDEVLHSFIKIFIHLGCRPAELLNIQILSNDVIFIRGAKKTEAGNRGLDRIIKCNPKLHNILNKCFKIIKEAEKNDPKFSVDKYRNKFKYLMKKTFPRRKNKACFYTFRHILGSKLKASKLNDFQTAYLMGHQSTKSIKKYGDKRYAKSSSAINLAIGPVISIEKIKKVVRDNKTNYKNIGKTKGVAREDKPTDENLNI